MVRLRRVRISEYPAVGGAGENRPSENDAPPLAFALFLAGIGACASAFAAFIIESVVGSGALGGMRGTGVFYYTLSVFVLAMCFLPKQLTRAPVQTVVFYKPKK